MTGHYVSDGLIDLLRSNGFHFDEPTYFIWEGNVIYVPLATDAETMRLLKQHVMEFRLSFDYLTEGRHEDHGRREPHDTGRELRGDACAVALRY